MKIYLVFFCNEISLKNIWRDKTQYTKFTIRCTGQQTHQLMQTLAVILSPKVSWTTFPISPSKTHVLMTCTCASFSLWFAPLFKLLCFSLLLSKHCCRCHVCCVHYSLARRLWFCGPPPPLTALAGCLHFIKWIVCICIQHHLTILTECLT